MKTETLILLLRIRGDSQTARAGTVQRGILTRNAETDGAPRPSAGG